MKPRWPTVPLGEVAGISTDRIEPSAHPSEYFYYIGLEHIEPHTGRLLPAGKTLGAEILSTKNAFRSGQILYGKLRPYLNKVHLAQTDGICSTDIFVIGTKPTRVHPAFVAYFLRSAHVLRRVEELMEGANLPRISRDDLLSLPIPLPPLSEQERMVGILDEAEGLRQRRAEADRRTAELLPALFHHMFGDPATNPKGWPIQSGAQIFSEIRYGVGTPPPFAPTGIRFLRAGNIKPNGVNDDNPVFFDPIHVNSIARSRVRKGDVVIVRRGANTGDCAVIPEEFDGAYVGYDLICVPAPSIEATWFATAFNLPSIKARVENLRRRAAQQGLNKQQILEFSLPCPPLSLQREFAARVGEVRELERRQAESRRRLDALFAALLDRAFNGAL